MSEMPRSPEAQEHPIKDFIDAHSVDELAAWIPRHAAGEYGPWRVPQDYQGPFAYFMGWLYHPTYLSAAQKLKIGDAALLALKGAVGKPEAVETLSPAVWVLAACPSSNRQEAAALLKELHGGAYKGVMSHERDVHREALIALITLDRSENDDVPLDEDLETPGYALAAHSLLVRRSMTDAFRRLPRTLEVLKQGKVPPHFLFCTFADVMTEEDEAELEKHVNGEPLREIRRFRRHLKELAAKTASSV